MSNDTTTLYNSLYETRDVLLNMTVIESLGFGIYSAIFWFTLYMLVFSRSKDQSAPRRGSTFCIIIPLYILAIIHLMGRWYVIRLSFVVHGQNAKSILDGFLYQPQWCLILSVVSFSLSTLISDFVTVWRCWLIWSRDWRVVALPLLLVTSGTVFCVIGVIYQSVPNSLSSSKFNRFAEFTAIYFGLSLASMVVSTILMVYRIVAVGRITGFKLESGYRKVIEIIVESAALYCVALAVYIPFLLRDDFSSGYSEAVLAAINGIAPTVIAGRVALGTARDYSTLGGKGRGASTLVFVPVMVSTYASNADNCDER